MLRAVAHVKPKPASSDRRTNPAPSDASSHQREGAAGSFGHEAFARPLYAFEAIDDALQLIPLSARRVLDTLGCKLTLPAWLSLSGEQRWQIVRAGARNSVDPEMLDLLKVVEQAQPPPLAIAAAPQPDAEQAPGDLLKALGAVRPLPRARWRALRPLDRYVLVKYAGKPDKLAAAYDEIVGPGDLTHLSASGSAHMVDVSDKATTDRCAVASACVRTTPQVLRAIAAGTAPKGDVLAVARVAGLLAAKRTPELIPLCHPVRTTGATIELHPDETSSEIRIRATVRALDRTGVEMEAMTAASIAALAVYDMIKGMDAWAIVERVQLEEKRGGKSGDVTRPHAQGPGDTVSEKPTGP